MIPSRGGLGWSLAVGSVDARVRGGSCRLRSRGSASCGLALDGDAAAVVLVQTAAVHPESCVGLSAPRAARRAADWNTSCRRSNSAQTAPRKRRALLHPTSAIVR